MVRVKISCFFQELSLYRPKVCLGVTHKRAKKWFSNNGPLCMITSDEEISPPSLVCKENSLQMHSLCTGVLLKFTASGIHLRKTSRWNLLTWRKYSQQLLHHFKVWVFGKIVNVSFQIRAQNMQQFLFSVDMVNITVLSCVVLRIKYQKETDKVIWR